MARISTSKLPRCNTPAFFHDRLPLHASLVFRYTGPGSDPKLKEKFMERCKNYNVNPNHQGLASANLPQDCPKLWDIFTKPFAFKDPCKPDSYEAFVTATSGPPMPANKVMSKYQECPVVMTCIDSLRVVHFIRHLEICQIQ